MRGTTRIFLPSPIQTGRITISLKQLPRKRKNVSVLVVCSCEVGTVYRFYMHVRYFWCNHSLFRELILYRNHKILFVNDLFAAIKDSSMVLL